MNCTLTHGDLFAGIGGFAKGFQNAGLQTMWHVEKDSSCQQLLRSQFPDHEVFGDIRECGKHNLTYVDIITFGSPCQDLSVAGRREGLKGERSGLFFEAMRIIGELQPAFAVWENVPGAFSSHSGRDFAAILMAFREFGARDIAWATLDAQYFGVPQRRRRIFLVADFRGERAAEILFEREGVRWHPPTRRKKGEEVAATAREGASRHIPDISRPCFAAQGTKWNGNGALEESLIAGTLAANGGGRDRPAGNANELDFCIPTSARRLRAQGQMAHREDVDTLVAMCLNSRNERYDGESQTFAVHPLRAGRRIADSHGDAGNVVPSMSSVRRLTPLECERLQGFPDHWTAAFADGVRYRMLGNAVAVPVAEWLGRRIALAAETDRIRADTEGGKRLVAAILGKEREGE